jgi:hypothetical protein
LEPQPDEEDPESLSLHAAKQRDGEARITSDRQQENPDVAIVPPRVEDQRSPHQYRHAGAPVPKARGDEVRDASGWQKNENELIGVEQHLGLLSAPRPPPARLAHSPLRANSAGTGLGCPAI